MTHLCRPARRALCARAILLLAAVATVGQLGCHQTPSVRGAPPTLKRGDGSEYLAHEVIVHVAPGTTTQALEAVLAQVGGRVIDAGGALGELGYRRIEIPTSLTADVAISQLSQASGGIVLNAEVNYVVHASVTPNDARFSELWGMTKISAPAAWDITTGSSSVLVAVSDTGIDYTHPDLAANVWKNPGEIPGNGKDDDNNGYIDDVYGYDFANDDGDPMDDHGHGTHVSGTIGGVANNALGVAGLNWNVKIMGAKFLSASGSGTSWGGAQTISYAAKMKARVVNASWGCFGSGCYASYIEDALKALDAAGGLFVAAAGNNGNNNDVTPTYPANYAVPNVITVAATDSSDVLASFSNYGATTVDLAAPGVGILSTVAGGGYASWSGTSMATPHVTGAAALMAALRSDATPEEIRQKLMDTADPVAGLGGKMVSGGRLNVRRLVASAGHPPAAPTGFTGSAGGHSDVLLSWKASPETDLAGYRLMWGTTSGIYPSTLNLGKDLITTPVGGLLHGTRYFFVIYAINASGLLSAPSAEVAVVAQDSVPPAQVVDLALRAVPGAQASGELVATSGEFSSFWSAANAVDGSPDTAWISPARQAPQEESLTFALDSPFLIDSVDLLPNAAYPDFFPVDFDVELSTDGETWSAIGGQRGASVVAGQHVHVAFSPTLAAQVRLRILRSAQHASGMYYASIAEMAVTEASSAPDSLTLTFTAPGDDLGVGRAQSYDIRRATTPITEATFDAAIAVPVSGQPLAAGLVETFTVAGLQGESTYYFAMKAIDDAGNRSPMSNVASASTLLIPPSTITDLRVSGAAADVSHPGMVVLLWTAPGGDGKSGQATRYELRFKGSAMTAGDFATATAVAGVAAPGVAGTAERFAVSGLASGRSYFFAIRAIDIGGTAGAVSNIVAAVPPDGDDRTPPATVRELGIGLSNAAVKLSPTIDSVSEELSSARAATNLLDGNLASAWMTKAGAPTAPAWVVFDLGSVQPLVRFRANPSSADLIASYPQDFQIQTSTDKASWTPIVTVQGLLGKFATWNEWASPVTNARYVRLYITRRGPAAGDSVYAAMGELEMYALTPALDADLTWVAPGDDGYDGVAVAYDLRKSTVPLGEGNFAAATAVPTLAPLPGGMIEVLHLAGVPLESTLYFALKAVDNNGNWSALSNVATLVAPGMNPAPVANLAVLGATTRSVTLGFTASGDDGNSGTATSYDLRYATSPITPATWATATAVPVAAPHAAGTAESVVVAGLAPTTLYYFGLVVVDDVGNRSLLSNIVAGSTRDGTPPNAIRDLVATPVDPTQRPPLALTVSDSSGSFSPDTAAKNLLDALDTTVWMGPDLAQVGGSVFAQLDLGGSKRLGRLRMRAGATYRDLFPVDFRLEIQAQIGGPWTAVVRETAFATLGGWEEWSLGSVPAIAARLVVTKANVWTGRTTPAVGDLELYEDPADFSKLRLAWTATGDDGNLGLATRYDLRSAGAAIDETGFGSATVLPSAPKPQAAGSLERFEASGLTGDTKYCFAVKAIDDEGNAGAVSNSPCATTPGVPPATITDLTLLATTASSATFTFTAPGADGNVGLASQYEIRRSDRRINSANWDTATPVTGASAPHVAGTKESFTASGLAGTTSYYFAVRALDGAGNAGALSNNASATTLDGVAPGATADLAVASNAALGGSLKLSWTAPGDNGTTGQARRYDVRVSTAILTDANFAGATAVTVNAPSVGGTAESATVTGLSSEALYYVALKTIDATGNTSALSNVASARTRDEAPAAVTNLAVASVTTQSVTLGFTASGDDGTSGTATAYDLRYATSPITALTWASATPATATPPHVAGTPETVVVAGLTPTTLYYFGVVVVDDAGNRSALSNIASGSTRDGTPPNAIRDLLATPVDPTQRPALALTVSDSSGSFSPDTAAKNLLDGLDTTVWMGPDLAQVGGSVFAQLDLGGQKRLGRLRMRAGSNYRDLFPVDFRLETQAQTGGAWSVVVRETAFATLGGWEEWMLGSVPAVAARLVVTRANAWTGRYTPALGDLELYEDPSDFSKLRLAWTATGDDGNVGLATRYDLRRAGVTLDETGFASATVLSAAKPQAPGSLERFEATGLTAETRYCFAVKAIDDVGNAGAISSSPCATTPGVPPATITDLAVAATSATTATLTFTAPGADGSVGQSSLYELRRSSRRINTTTWDTATPVALPGAPRAAGSAETITVSGLSGLSTYFFAVRATDGGGNTAALSNNATGTTLDDIPPGATTDLAAVSSSTQGGSLKLTWTAPGDNGIGGQAKRYDVRVSTTTITAANFAAATAVAVGAPGVGGTHESATVTGLGAESLYYVALETIDAAGNASALSNLASARTREEAPAAITNLAVVGGSGTGSNSATLALQWTAPGDDANVGTATSYEIRYSTGTITAATFAAATLASPPIAPAAAGTIQSTTLTGLAAGVKYSVAMIATDDRGNVSGLSNVAISTTPDEVPPATSTDLRATTGTTAGTLSLGLTAPGDDGVVGRATAYDVRYSLAAIDATSFASATALAAAVAPATGGTSQTFTISGLPNESVVHVALRTRDDAGNWSAVSNDASATTLDVAPTAISDLRLVARGTGTFTLAWTSTGDDGKVGTAAAYELRHAESPLTEANFATATASAAPSPAGAGSAESASISGLAANKTFYFAIRAIDDRGNASTLSNVLTAATEDTVAPGAIALSAATGAAAGSITLSWTATGDDGGTGTAKRTELRRSTSAIDAGNWSAATLVASTAPKVAGSPETVTATGLKGESTFHFAIRAFDEVDNAGPISNDAAADTAPVPPAAVVLTASLVVANGVATATLSWIAPGDDGTEGQATAYDLRSATTPLSASSFASATPIVAPAPATSGTAQSVVVANLRESTTYYFALETVDDTQTWSDLSNVASVKVPDLTKPGAPAALSVGVPDVKGKPIAVTKVTASSTLGPAWDGSNAIDGDTTSSWASTGSDGAAPESLVLDLATVQSIERVKLTPDGKYLDLFPRGFSIAVSIDNRTWKTIATEQSFRATTADALTWGIPAEPARYVRLAIDDTGTSFGKHYAILAEVEIDSASATDGRAQLTWLAPGDDLYAGTATRYEVYRSTHAFTEADLAAVTSVSGVPAPLPSGSLQTMTVTGLHGETTYFWAIRAIDEAGNLGALSAVVASKTNDVPPAAVRDLAGTAAGGTSIQLRWTATGDDGAQGTAQSTEIRYLAGPLGATSFAQATLVPGLPAPAPAGTQQTVTVGGLAPGVAYRFALVAKDTAGNASYLSNIALVSTQRPADTTPPATITDLTVALPAPGGKLVTGTVIGRSSEQAPDFTAASAGDGNTETFWASTARAASQEEWIRLQYPSTVTADRVRAWPAAAYPDLFPPDVTVRVSPDGLAWTTVATQTGLSASPGSPITIPFPAIPLRFVELRATRLAHHASGMYYAVLAEVELLTASEPAGTIAASWTAPSDDGPSGSAAAYDLRVGTCPFDPATAAPVTTSAPSEAGAPERVRITGRTSGAYCVSVSSLDAAGNVSAWSNVATIAVP